MVATRKSKVTLTCKLVYLTDLTNHYDSIKNKYGNNSRLLFTETDTFMHDIKIKGVYEDFSKDKKCFILVIIQLSQNIMMAQTN